MSFSTLRSPSILYVSSPRRTHTQVVVHSTSTFTLTSLTSYLCDLTLAQQPCLGVVL
jgi:hypothetical protein